jgi:hypothetical protein
MTFCVSYMWIHILISDDCKAEILDSDIDIPTTAPHKHFLICPLVFASESETRTVRGRM